MQKEDKDLRDRTKAFALRVVRMFSALPKTTEAQELARPSRAYAGCSYPAQPRSAISRRVFAQCRSRSGNALSPCHPYPWRPRFPLHTPARWSRRKNLTFTSPS